MKGVAIRRALWVCLGLLVLLQIPGPRLHNPPVNPERSLLRDPSLDSKVRHVLVKSCADCHSAETKWPPYAHIAPISFLIARDVREGRARLNFSEWPRNPTGELEEIYDTVDRRFMPPREYLLMHPNARLSDEDQKVLKDWIDSQSRPERSSLAR